MNTTLFQIYLKFIWPKRQECERKHTYIILSVHNSGKTYLQLHHLYHIHIYIHIYIHCIHTHDIPFF